MQLIVGESAYFANWAAQHLDTPIDTTMCHAIGIMDGANIIGSVVYSHYYGHDMQMTIATVSPRWCTRGVLRALFDYPFNQLGCARVTAVTTKRNKAARKLLGRLGFVLEGVLRNGYDGRRHALVYGLLRDDCEWRVNSGKKRQP